MDGMFLDFFITVTVMNILWPCGIKDHVLDATYSLMSIKHLNRVAWQNKIQDKPIKAFNDSALEFPTQANLLHIIRQF